MTTLQTLQHKKKKLVVGLMSGTSADSIDAVLAEIVGNGVSAGIRQRAFNSLPYPKGYMKFLLENSLPGHGSVDTISTLNILSAAFFADAVKAVARRARVPLNTIDLIGSHGQTIHHLPAGRKLFGKTIRSTLQIGDPSTIAALTGIPTVGNFRTADMALGGQGAPLVPYFDYVAFRSAAKNRLLVNIGGIANITLLKRKCSIDDVIAFDTGPGNMVIDALMQRFYNKAFDSAGMIARKGTILTPLLKKLLNERYFTQRPPKSTGREMFGIDFVKKALFHSRGNKKEDIIATLTELTALTIRDQFDRFVRRRLFGEPLDEIIVSGGGTKNDTLMETIQRYFEHSQVSISGSIVSSDAKEALCFALLANETIHERASSIPSVTGAVRSAVLGTIAFP